MYLSFFAVNKFHSYIESSKKNIKNLQESIDKISAYIESGQVQDAINESFNYERIAEKTVNIARLLPSVSGMPKANIIVEKNILSENNVFVEYTKNGWFHVKLPFLLPKKEKGNPSYIRTTLNTALASFFAEHERVFFDDCVLIFNHCYSEERKKYRDHDNIELNSVVDLLALYVMVDDAPMRCQHYYFSSISDYDYTEVFIVPKKDFIMFLTETSFCNI